jgi:hypothetical protein
MTVKQRKAARKYAALYYKTGEKPDMGKVMVDSGYSPETAKNPGQKLTRRLGWDKALEKYIPEELLLKRHNEALDATKPIGALVLIKNGEDGTQTVLKDNEGMIEVADHKTRLDAVKLGYQILGKLREGGVAVQINNNMEELAKALKIVAQDLHEHPSIS